MDLAQEKGPVWSVAVPVYGIKDDLQMIHSQNRAVIFLH